MALEAPYFRREHVIQRPGRRNLVNSRLPDEKFVAEENVNYEPPLVHEGGEKQYPTTTAVVNNVNSPSSLSIRRSALTFDPSSPLNEVEEYSLSAP